MQDVNALLDACKEAAKATSDNQLASALGIGRSAISNYRHGRAFPDAVVCATIAGLSGIPLARVLGIVGEARAISREEKAVWRKLAATAALVLCAIGVTAGNPAQAASDKAPYALSAAQSSEGMHIMSKVGAVIRSWLGSCLRWWLASLWDRRRAPKDSEIAA